MQRDQFGYLTKRLFAGSFNKKTKKSLMNLSETLDFEKITNEFKETR